MARDRNLEAILAILTGLLVLYFFFRLELIVSVAAVLGLVSLFSRTIRGIVGRLWYKGSEWIGFLLSKILLSLVFFVLLVPISFMARLFRGRTLALENDRNSFFVARNHEYRAKDLENPW